MVDRIELVESSPFNWVGDILDVPKLVSKTLRFGDQERSLIKLTLPLMSRGFINSAMLFQERCSTTMIGRYTTRGLKADYFQTLSLAMESFWDF